MLGFELKKPGDGFSIIGIDPGFTGALGALQVHNHGPKNSGQNHGPKKGGGPNGLQTPSADLILEVIDMPVITNPLNGKKSVDPVALAAWIRRIGPVALAVVEQVASAPNQGVVSTFSFGQGYGTVLGVLGALGIKTQLVNPVVWKKSLNLSSNKTDSLDLARQLFPAAAKEFRLAKNHGKAESILLACFGKRFIPNQVGAMGVSDLL